MSENTGRTYTCDISASPQVRVTGWAKALLIMIIMNQQFAVYPDSSTTSSNPMPYSAEIVPPTSTKIRTLTQIKTTLSPLNR